jgi:hypothetical protein
MVPGQGVSTQVESVVSEWIILKEACTDAQNIKCS